MAYNIIQSSTVQSRGFWMASLMHKRDDTDLSFPHIVDEVLLMELIDYASKRGTVSAVQDLVAKALAEAR